MRRRVFLAAIWCMLGLALAGPAAAQQRDSSHWLPPEVQGWLSIPDVEQLGRSWEQTQFGRLLAGELFEKVRQAWERQREELDVEVAGLKITWEEIRQIAGGEVALAIVHPRDKKPTPVLLVDFRGHVDQAGDVIRQLDARLRPSGKRHAVEYRLHREFSPVVVQYVRRHGNRERTLLVYFYFNQVLCLTKDVSVAKAIRASMESADRPSLAAEPVFRATMAGLASQRQESKQPVQLRWFARPLGLARAVRALKGKLLYDEESSEVENVDWFEVFSRTGFEQIQGAAGVLALAGKPYDVEHRIKIYAPRPWKGAVNVLALYNHQHVLRPPPAWVGGKLAGVGRLRLNVLQAFDHFGPLFDEIKGQGSEGVWEDTLDAIRNAKDGPQVDLRGEIVAQLEHDCLLVTAANKTQTHDRPRRVVIFAIKDSPQSRKVVAAAIDRYFEPEATLRTDLVPGAKIWVLLPREDDGPEIQVGPVQIDVGDQQPGVVVPAPKPSQASEPEGVCVYGGHLFYATHVSLLVDLLKKQKALGASDAPAARSPEFQRVFQAVQQEAQRQGWKALSLFRFEDSAQQYRNTYRLARQNKIATSRNMVIQMLIGLGRLVDENGEQLIDGKLLPPFEKVAEHLPPGGLMVHSDPDGWSIVSFVLHPSAP